MKVIFGGGGTGGHLYPAISVAEKLKEHNIDFYFMVSDRGIEAKILSGLGYPYEEQKVSAFMGQGITGKIKAILNTIKASVNAMKIVKKGDKIFLTGGFAAAPPAVAGLLKGCDIYMHEQNSVMGLVNRIFAKFSKKVFLSFENTQNIKKKDERYIVTGNPVRNKFNTIKKKAGYDGRLLILGGSQGSRKINSLIASSIDALMEEGFTIIHQTGGKLYDETVEKYGDKLNQYGDRIKVTPYIDNIAEEMSSADIIVARSGAGAIFEILALNCPALYIPFGGASENHQYYNALYVEQQGGCIILDENNAVEEKLLSDLKQLRDNIEDYRKNISEMKKYDSSMIIYKEITESRGQ